MLRVGKVGKKKSPEVAQGYICIDEFNVGNKAMAFFT